MDQDGLPDASFYAPETMMPEKRKAFEKWYSEHKDDHFNLQRELRRYCKHLVNVRY